jgi:hypothetical protein
MAVYLTFIPVDSKVQRTADASTNTLFLFQSRGSAGATRRRLRAGLQCGVPRTPWLTLLLHRLQARLGGSGACETLRHWNPTCDAGMCSDHQPRPVGPWWLQHVNIFSIPLRGYSTSLARDHGAGDEVQRASTAGALAFRQGQPVRQAR